MPVLTPSPDSPLYRMQHELRPPRRRETESDLSSVASESTEKFTRGAGGEGCFTPVKAVPLASGAFNVCYRVTYGDGHDVVVRFIGLGRIVARSEKVEDEVTIMQYVAQHTRVLFQRFWDLGAVRLDESGEWTVQKRPFTFNWLFLEEPEDWDTDFDQFLVRFMPRFHTFLGVLKECEAKIQDGSLPPSQRLSVAMEKSLETALFWMCLASRHSSMFDEIYWKFIDPRFHGPFRTIEDRSSLLSAEERANIDTVVQNKMRQTDEGTLDSHYSIHELVEL
ncbi:hypothetical protein ASPACDRAFT_1885228 [Aspergillus aculeatus ATCC 16872]|uniref:Aminoglycoside phosphotransferase domain-containing protein n=1 Tax=Aspergillus aculeatus (strain ATCC 16872 / CBS 172.66 / WB 5094) TaxID=690307 RepID=A0A1L9X5X1_ASPA1|nr:uncharacterized protein ASPACDRAFT_1885228 [Aspergillus aculeatus ATCC 16872]OJK03729.1 hypothetical protein ASPACDRAFT_1885228 [Aspergillus aculeatus ATCC 16872]